MTQTAQTREALVELMADATLGYFTPEDDLEYVADVMSAALLALEAAGVRLVPAEATEEMLDASWHAAGESKEMRPRTHAHYARHYQYMLSASPYAKEPTND